MLSRMALLFISCTQLSYAEVYKTLDDYDKTVANYCMDNKDPMIPSTYSCEDSHQAEISDLHSTVNQMLIKLDATYEPDESLYPTFPALSTGIFNIQATSFYGTNYLPKYAVFNTLIGSQVGCWKSLYNDTNQYIVMGSSVPFVFEKIVTAGSGSLNQWVKSFTLYYSLDGSWIKYEGTFQSNTDDNSIFELALKPFVARAIRIYPNTWNYGIAMRIEVYVSKHNFNAQPLKGRVFPAIHHGYNVAFSNLDFGDFDGYDKLQIYFSPRFAIRSGEWIKITAGYLMKWSRLIIYDYHYNSGYNKIVYIYYTQDEVSWSHYSTWSFDGTLDASFNIFANSLRLYFVDSYPDSHLCFNLEVFTSEA